MTDQELDSINKRVAKALGYRISLTHGGQVNYPDFSRSIEAAWEIVEEIRERFIVSVYSPIPKILNPPSPVNYSCNIAGQNHNDEWQVCKFADTAPLAICLAFLELKERDDAHA